MKACVELCRNDERGKKKVESSEFQDSCFMLPVYLSTCLPVYLFTCLLVSVSTYLR